MVSQDELVIAIVLLVTWGLATAAMVLDRNRHAKLGRRWHAGHIRKVFGGGVVGLTSGRPSSLRIRGFTLRSSLRSLYAGTVACEELLHHRLRRQEDETT